MTNLKDTATGVAILALTGVTLYVLWKGKAAIESVAGAASDAIDTVSSHPGEAPAANPASRAVDAVIFGTTRDVNGTSKPANSLGTWLYDNTPDFFKDYLIKN